MPSATLVGTGFLPAYSLKFHKVGRMDGSGKCNIVPGNCGVFVAIFDIDESERKDLDRCEGLGFGYNHQEIQLRTFGTCSTYVADASAIVDTLYPFDWYKEYVCLGAQYHGFPAEYIAALESTPAVVDSNLARAGQQWKLIEELGT